MMNTKPETNMQRDAREMAEAQAQLRAETARDPMFGPMAEAMRVTAKEQAAIDAAQAAVAEAEAAVDAAGFTLARAERGQAPSYDKQKPFSFFERSKSSHKAAAEAAVPGLRIDLEEARNRLQLAIRRRNDTTRRIELARMERRAQAKRRHAPPPVPVRSRSDRWSGGKDAA